MTAPVIHLCDWSQQPDIRIQCEQKWTQPEWDTPENAEFIASLPDDVHLATNGQLYTFEEKCVTCEKCKS